MVENVKHYKVEATQQTDTNLKVEDYVRVNGELKAVVSFDQQTDTGKTYRGYDTLSREQVLDEIDRLSSLPGTEKLRKMYSEMDSRLVEIEESGANVPELKSSYELQGNMLSRDAAANPPRNNTLFQIPILSEEMSGDTLEILAPQKTQKSSERVVDQQKLEAFVLMRKEDGSGIEPKAIISYRVTENGKSYNQIASLNVLELEAEKIRMQEYPEQTDEVKRLQEFYGDAQKQLYEASLTGIKGGILKNDFQYKPSADMSQPVIKPAVNKPF